MGKPTACVECYNAVVGGILMGCTVHHASEWQKNSNAWQNDAIVKQIERERLEKLPTSTQAKVEQTAAKFDEIQMVPRVKPICEMRATPRHVFPVVTLAESSYRDPSGETVSAESLVEMAKDLPVFDLDVHALNLGQTPFDPIESAYDLIAHAMRISATDPAHPVIMNADGFIMDGWHRVMRAVIEGRRFIPAKRFTEMMKFPKPE